MWTLPDDALLAGLADGDRDASVAFVRRFQQRVFGLALAITSDRALAEDVAQETFVRVWKAAPTYDGRRGSVTTWLLTIARNVAIDAVRMRRAIPADPSSLVNLLPSSTIGTPDETALTHREREQVRRALVGLPDPQRRAIVLATVGGLTASEISDVEGIPLGTAKTRIRTAMHTLRAKLTDLSVVEEGSP
jgi:RNA polymerase sigma-70 factor (ECF subfamily)